MKRTVHATVSGENSALSRVTAVFSRHRLNIGSLTYKRSGGTDGTSDMRIVTDIENEQKAEQLIKQLNKLVDVISAESIRERQKPERDTERDKANKGAAPEMNPGR